MNAVTTCLAISVCFMAIAIFCFCKMVSYTTSSRMEGCYLTAFFLFTILAAYTLFVGPSILIGANLIIPLMASTAVIIFCLGLGALKGLLHR